MTRHHSQLSALVFSMWAFAKPILFAQVVMPQQDEWRMHDGAVVRGKAYTFEQQACFLQRRNGTLLLKGQTINNPTSNVLVKKLCEEQGVPADAPKKLEAVLSKQRFARIALPYYTLKYDDQTGRDQQIPTMLLAPAEQQQLRPLFEEWRAHKQREHEERMRQAQEVQDRRTMLALQAEANRVTRAIAEATQANAIANFRNANASERSAAANEKSAAELERIRQQSR